MAKKVLITGAGGFIGSFIVEEALNRGYETWAAVRATTSREFLIDDRIKFIELDFTNAEVLTTQLTSAVEMHGKWDYIIHNLGATKCTNFMDFNTINYIYLKTFVETLVNIDAVPSRFLFMSSLSAIGTGHQKSEKAFSTKVVPNPNTKYGLSKIKAEMFLQMQNNFPYIIFRPTGVYGPREKDYYLIIKSIARGFDFGMGFRKRSLSFVYVKDLARGMFEALEAGIEKKAYIISEERSYRQAEFRKCVTDNFKLKFALPIYCPVLIAYIVCFIAEKWGTITLKPSTLNRDKYKIMKQRNWACDISEAQKDFNFNPKYSLKDGMRETIDWYKENGWLKNDDAK